MNSSIEDIYFTVRTITWSHYELVSPILLQHLNGPCPLVALTNTVILREEIKHRNHILGGSNDLEAAPSPIMELKAYLLKQTRIELQDLLSRLAELVIYYYEINQPLHHYDLDKLLASLSLLHTGLSVNPNLLDGTFEQDLAIDLFSIFDLRLLHAWVVDNDSVREKVEELKYFDSIQDYLLDKHDLEITAWLDANSTQMTEKGMRLVDNKLQPDDIVVLFRNNHFSTLFKKDVDDIYVLLTDSSFGDNTKIVWQSLVSSSGNDDLFFTGDFVPVLEEQSTVDEDLLLVKKFQEQDDEEYAKKLQESYEKRNHLAKKSTPKPNGKESKIKQEKRDKKPLKGEKDQKDKKEKKSKLDCVIV